MGFDDPRLHILDGAILDLEAPVAWYQARSRQAMDNLLIEVQDAVARILERPLAWSPYRRGTRRILLHGFPIGLVYVTDGKSVTLVAVADSRRDPDYWVDRLSEP